MWVPHTDLPLALHAMNVQGLRSELRTPEWGVKKLQTNLSGVKNPDSTLFSVFEDRV